MKSRCITLPLILLALLADCQVFAQEQSASVATTIESTVYDDFTVAVHFDRLGAITWGGILFWAIALLPIGIISIRHAATLQSKRWPLSSNMLLLGLFGSTSLLALGQIRLTRTLADMHLNLVGGMPTDIGLLTHGLTNVTHAQTAVIIIMHCYLACLLISIAITHFKMKHMEKNS